MKYALYKSANLIQQHKNSSKLCSYLQIPSFVHLSDMISRWQDHWIQRQTVKPRKWIYPLPKRDSILRFNLLRSAVWGAAVYIRQHPQGSENRNGSRRNRRPSECPNTLREQTLLCNFGPISDNNAPASVFYFVDFNIYGFIEFIFIQLIIQRPR